MKRFVFAFSTVLALASCNNSGGNAEQRIKDSLDSLKNLKIESVNDAAQQATDTIEKHHDSLNKMIDSVADKTRDSLNQIKK